MHFMLLCVWYAWHAAGAISLSMYGMRILVSMYAHAQDMFYFMVLMWNVCSASEILQIP